MKEFIEYVTRQLVNNPEQLILEEETIGDTLIFKLKVTQSDIDKIIGRKGRTIVSLRTIIAAVGKKTGKKVKLEVVI